MANNLTLGVLIPFVLMMVMSLIMTKVWSLYLTLQLVVHFNDVNALALTPSVSHFLATIKTVIYFKPMQHESVENFLQEAFQSDFSFGAKKFVFD